MLINIAGRILGGGEDPAARSIIRNVGVIIRFVLWTLAALFFFSNLGFDVTTVLAGLGIGGAAIALASQAVLGDLLACLAIYLDKPFKPGDFIIVGEDMGEVEHIGLKTTRVRSLWGEQLVFSNTQLTSARIRNFEQLEERRVQFGFGVVYETPVEKVKRIPDMLRGIFKDLTKTRLDRAHFKSFGDSSLDFEIVYFVLASEYNEYMDIHQEIILRIMETFEKEAISFAYPTRTIHLERARQSLGEGGI